MDLLMANYYGDEQSRVDPKTVERISKEMVNLIMKQIAPSSGGESSSSPTKTNVCPVSM